MTKVETGKIMSVLEVAYPRYYAGQDEEKKKQAVALWYMMLKEQPYELVQTAVKAVIATNTFPPTVAEIIEKINNLKNGSEMTELEAWGYISKAIRSSTYRAREEWESLPVELQSMVSPDLLRSWAMVEADDVETVLQSNFLRMFRSARAKRKEYDALPGSVKQSIAQVSGEKEESLRIPEVDLDKEI